MSLSMPVAAVPECDDVRLDAARLRQAREERGLSVAEAARWLTLSNAQVEQIEEGGLGAFYSPAHKALAVRKYASAVGLDPDGVLGLGSVPDSQAATAEELGDAVAEPVAPVAAVSEAPGEAARLSGPSAPAVTIPSTRPAAVAVRASASSLLVGLLLFCTVAIAFAILRGWVERFAEPRIAMAALPAGAPPAAIDPAPAVPIGGVAAAPAALPPAPETDCVAGAGDAGVPQWMPAYVRKPGTRLYISGPQDSEVCVSDSAGKVARLVLKAGAMQSVDGRPPYLVQSTSLDALQMFLQGLKVKVPSQSGSIRLLPGERVGSPEAGAAAPLPAS